MPWKWKHAEARLSNRAGLVFFLGLVQAVQADCFVRKDEFSFQSHFIRYYVDVLKPLTALPRSNAKVSSSPEALWVAFACSVAEWAEHLNSSKEI